MATPTDNGRVVPTDIVLQFTSIPDCITCEPVTFDWTYSGNPNFELVLSVTNIGLSGIPDTTPLLSQNIAIINDGLLDDQTSFTWDAVTVPGGLYALEAWIAGIPFMSSTFTVTNGTDTSCLPNSTPPPTTRSLTTSSAHTSPPSTSTNPSNDLPVSGGVSNDRMSGGTIAGIVFAIIGLLGALLGAFVLYRFYRRRNSERRPLSPTRTRAGFFEKGHSTSWRTGGSAGAKLVYGGQPPEGFGANDSAAFGVNEGRHGHINNSSSNRSSPGASEEDVASLSEEKMVTNAPSSAYDFVAATGLPTLPSRYRSSAVPSIADSTASRPRLQTRNSDPFANPRVLQLPVGMYDESLQTPASPAFPQSVSASPASTRRRLSGESARSNLTGLGLGASSTQSHGNTSGQTHSHSHSHSQPQLLSPPGRRTMSARKPVPVYSSSPDSEAHELALPTTLRSGYISGTHSGTGSGSRSSLHDWSSTAQVSHAASPSTLASPSVSSIGESSPIPRIAHPGLPELNHKSSFGDRPVHYLIPDPPPPGRQ